MSFCGKQAPAWEWSRHPHTLMADINGASCIHCGRRVPTERAQAARAAACPCHILKCGHEEVIEGKIMLRGVLALRACWHAWFRGAATALGP